MKGSLTLRFLDGLDKGEDLLSDLFVVFTAPYGTSLSGMDYRLNRYRRERNRAQEQLRRRRQFSNLLYHLETQGIIEVKPGRKKCLLTNQGKKYLRILRSRAKSALPSPNYEREKEDTLKIVAFDIPETMRRKRAWIREVLRNLDFQMLQRSIWVGTAKLPISFLHDLKSLRILSYVKIFTVARSGNIHSIDSG